MSRALRALLAALVVVLLAGCAGIPTSGPVIAGRPAGNDPLDMFDVEPDGPRKGAAPEETVIGFLRAAGGFKEDHRVARSFLAPSRKLSWRPDASVVVYPGSTAPDPVARPEPQGTPPAPGASPSPARTKVAVDVDVEATIDGDGRFTPAAAGKRQAMTYDLVQVEGEWRIDSLPDGILISSSDFAVSFRPFPVYFPDSGGSYLVPDVHWFPGSVEELPTALVRALLRGPARWLQPAVTTGVPQGTQMSTSAVVVSGRVATVDLTEQARNADSRQRQFLARQLQATLGTVGNIAVVRITADQVDLEVPAGDPDDSSRERRPGPQGDPRVDARPVVLDAQGRIARLEGAGTLTPVAGIEGLDVAGTSHPAVNSNSSVYAVLAANRGRLLLQMPGMPPAQLAFTGRELTAPSFDPSGWAWSTPAAGTGTVYAAKVGETERAEIQAPWLAQHEIVSLRVSRDGARVLVATRRNGRAYAYVAGVVRAGDGRPESLTEPVSSDLGEPIAPGLVPDLVSVEDAAWADEDQVVLLGRRQGVPGAADTQPWVVQVGGKITGIPSPPAPQSISAGNGELALVAGTPTGVYTRAGTRWEKAADARDPAYPG